MTLSKDSLKQNFLDLHTGMTGITNADQYAEKQLEVYQKDYALLAQLPPIVIFGEDFSEYIAIDSVGEDLFKNAYKSIYGMLYVPGSWMATITIIVSAYVQYWSTSTWKKTMDPLIIGIVEVSSVVPDPSAIGVAQAALIAAYYAQVVSFNPASSMTAEEGAELQATMYHTFTTSCGVIISGTVHWSWTSGGTIPDAPFVLNFPLI